MKRFLFLLAIIIITVVTIFYIQVNEKTKSGLQILTGDTPASLFLDGNYLEKSPFIDENIKPGTYNLSIKPEDENLTPYETTVTLNKGLITVVDWRPNENLKTSYGFTLQMEKIGHFKQAEVSFVTIPDNAIIQVDDRDQEFSPLIIDDLNAGEHYFRISLPAYQTIEQTIMIKPGHRINVFAKLGREPDSLSSAKEASMAATLKEKQATPSAEIENDTDIKISPSPKVTSMPTNTPTPSTQTTSDAEIEKPYIVIKPTNFTKDGVEGMRVREKPTQYSKELGFAVTGEKYKYLEETELGWFKIQFDNQEAWVSGKYITLYDI